MTGLTQRVTDQTTYYLSRIAYGIWVTKGVIRNIYDGVTSRILFPATELDSVDTLHMTVQ